MTTDPVFAFIARCLARFYYYIRTGYRSGKIHAPLIQTKRLSSDLPYVLISWVDQYGVIP
jgi:hypothetical protein